MAASVDTARLSATTTTDPLYTCESVDVHGRSVTNVDKSAC
jgi:hypothetical protein